MYDDNAKMQSTAQQQYLGAQQTAVNAAPQSMSESIISRLQSLRSYASEISSMANHAAEKIVGSAPTPIAGNSTGQIKGERPPASSFLDGVQQLVGDLEAIARDTQEHLNRIHRQF